MDNKPIDMVATADPASVTELEAGKVGEQMGMTAVAAIVDSGFLRYIGSSVETMKKTNHYRAFVNSFFTTIEKSCDLGMPGMQERARIARFLQAGHVALREQLHGLAMTGGEVDVGVMDSLLETGEIIERSTNALLKPIEEDLKVFCLRAKQAKLVMASIQSQQADSLRDSVPEEDCNNPNCTVHRTH